jgi:truncated hemoglobin YjbI
MNDIVYTFYSKNDKKKVLGHIYKKDLLEDGTCEIYVYQYTDKKGLKKLKYTSSKEIYLKALEENNKN